MPDSNALSDAIVLRTANAVAQMGVSGYGGVAFQIQGSFSGTITFEASVHGGEFEPLRVVATDNSTAVTTTTTTGIYIGSAVGLTTVRARMSSYSTGAASVHIRADVASPGGSGGGGGVGSDVNLIEVGGASIALGQTTMSASLPVTIASDQSAIPVTGSISATNPSVSATGAAVPAEATYIGILDPDGNLRGLSAETFDYDTGAGTALVTAFGISIPGVAGAPLPILGGHGTASQALRVELPTDGNGTLATVSTVTNVGTLGTLTNALPAGTNLLGRVSASSETNTVYDGTTALTPKFAAIAASSSGNNTLVAAVTAKKIRVLAYNFISNGTVNAKFQSGAGGTDLTGLKYCIANMGLSASFCPVGWFESASGALLNLNLSAGVAVGGELVYVEV